MGPPSSLVRLALVFLRLGATSFGGPAAHVAMMEEEFVRRRSWLSRTEFLDLLGATNMIPGPNSTELALHIGHRRAGFSGLLVAGASFILPAVVMVLGPRLGLLPVRASAGRGGRALRSEARDGRRHLPGPLGLWDALRSRHPPSPSSAWWRWDSAWRACTSWWSSSEPGRRVVGDPCGPERSASSSPSLVPLPWLGAAAVATAPPFQLSTLFLVFLKVGAVLFGSGYVLLAFLRSELVVRLGWLSEAQLLDAVSIGQVTPGPVFSTATFVGYVLGGHAGALVATVGIFLPAFFFVAVSGPLVPRLRRSPTAGAFLDGVNVASLALMAVVTAQLGRHALVDLPTVLLALASAVLLLRFRVNSIWLVLGGLAVGVAVSVWR